MFLKSPTSLSVYKLTSMLLYKLTWCQFWCRITVEKRWLSHFFIRDHLVCLQNLLFEQSCEHILATTDIPSFRLSQVTLHSKLDRSDNTHYLSFFSKRHQLIYKSLIIDISTVGITVREALGKAMKLRKLAPETCKVYKVNDKVRLVSFLCCVYIYIKWDCKSMRRKVNQIT